VAEDTPVRWTEMPKAEADALGAIGLFGEKYGDVVRVVSAGDFSKELCGGTHVSRTGEIGPFKVISEGSVGSGARRIEALTGAELVRWYARRTEELERELEGRTARLAELESELKRARQARVEPSSLAADPIVNGAVRGVAAEAEGDADDLLALADGVRRTLGDGAAVVLGARAQDRVALIASLGPEAVAQGLSAVAIIREIAPLVNGGGGGKPQMARAGGKDPAGLPAALERARELLAAPAP
jgi:alanyl-tRNA synthetase